MLSMEISYFDEPQLQFANDYHVCPRCGITEFDVYDSIPELETSKPQKIMLGVIGTSPLLEKFNSWIKASMEYVSEKPSKQPNLFPPFPGFNPERGFKCEITLPAQFQREIQNSDIEQLIESLDIHSQQDREHCAEEIANIFLVHIKFLAQMKAPGVIVCLLPTKLIEKVLQVSIDESSTDENLEENQEKNKTVFDFRCYVKAKSMKYGIPLQLLKESTIETTSNNDSLNKRRTLQDMATRAWNFFTALYYKAGGIPWKTIEVPRNNRTCYVGISFYKSIDGKTLHTSSAQVFDEFGKGVILRGGEAMYDKEDKIPHLTQDGAFALLDASIRAYNFAESNPPKRIVVHKSSLFTPEEKSGFLKAIKTHKISTHDFVTIYSGSKIKLFRNGQYPPLRGTFLKMNDKEGVFYTRGSVEFYRTYTGLYVPNPIHIQVMEQNSSLQHICAEILSLTKMNWNKTQFDGKLPITLLCSRSVGDVLKYLENTERGDSRYSFYM
jgi:hypothetical protein